MRSLTIALFAIVHFSLALGACSREPASLNAPAHESSATPASASARPAMNGTIAEEPEETVAGVGACRADSDCELTTYQEGCCTHVCVEYATSKAALAARQSKEDCAKWTKPCPRPAPCRPATFIALRAVCQSGTCARVQKPAPPKPEPTF